MIVTALLVNHDGERWLPAVLDGLAAQTRPVDRTICVDTGSRDASAALLAATPQVRVVQAETTTSYPAAVRIGLESENRGDPTAEWIWLLHDDSNPAPDALAALLRAAAEWPEARILGPKIREWPSLRRLVEIGVTISGTGRRETGLERGEYDQGQHDEVRPVLAVNTAGMLVRRDVLEQLGGLDEALPIFGNDIDFGWRAARTGHTTLVVPQAVLFHAEAARRGVRRTALTGTHPHRVERRAALFTLLANVESRRFPWQYLRLLVGSLLRVLGLLVVRAPGEARDELAALFDVYAHPGQVRVARRARRDPAQVGVVAPRGADRRARALLAPWWLPWRHGLDFVVDLTAALTQGAADVAERRRASRAAMVTPLPEPAGRRMAGASEDEDESFYADSGWVVRFLTNPVALVMTLAFLVILVASRHAFGSVLGGALSPAPTAVADWWRLHAESHHALGTGSDVPAPGYVAVLAVLGTLVSGASHAITVVMVASIPLGVWGAWRLLRVLGHVVDPAGVPRWVLVWGSLTYGLVPATSGAWGQGRFGIVVAAGLLPWLAHAALGFADPEPRRRWRAGWRTGVLLALMAAFVPMVWPVAVALVAILLVFARVVSRTLLTDRSSWLPPILALVAVPLLLAPWLVPMIFSGARVGLLLEAGRLPVSPVGFTGLLSGHLEGTGSPTVAGLLLAIAAIAALLPRRSRIAVLGCWLVALATAVVVAALSFVRLDLGLSASAPGLGLFVVLLQGTFVAAVALGLGSAARRFEARVTIRRAVGVTLAVIVGCVPVTGMLWWLSDGSGELTAQQDSVVPAYMEQSSRLGPGHGVLVLAGSVENGLTYRIRRDDGITVGEDEILALTPEDERFTAVVKGLTADPDPDLVDALAADGIEYVVMSEPVAGRIAATLDATVGLQPASAEDRSTRAWKVDRPLAADGLGTTVSPGRMLLLGVQVLAVLVLLVMCGPDLRSGSQSRTQSRSQGRSQGGPLGEDVDE